MKEIPEDELEQIKENFSFADTDGNGLIDFREFAGLLKILSPETKVHQAAEGFSMVDKNSDGYVDYEEFIDWWQSGWTEY